MINKLISSLFFCSVLVFNSQALAGVCAANDLECQKAQAMEEAGIKPLITRDPEQALDAKDAKDANNGPKPFVLPEPSANNGIIINPGLDFAPQHQSPEVVKAINEAKQMASQASTPNIDTPPIPAPKIESLKTSLIIGSTVEIKPVGGSAIVIPPSSQLAPSIYR